MTKTKDESLVETGRCAYASIVEMVAALQTATDDDDARMSILEDALSVEVRSGWVSLGADRVPMEPEEFCILLTTGGPAVRIRGELDEHKEPSRACIMKGTGGGRPADEVKP